MGFEGLGLLWKPHHPLVLLLAYLGDDARPHAFSKRDIGVNLMSWQLSTLSSLGSIGFRLLWEGGFCSHPEPVRMPQGTHLGVFVPNHDIACTGWWRAGAKGLLLGGSDFFPYPA